MQGRQDKSEPDKDNQGTLGQSFVNWANAGILGFHMISGPLLGIFLGYYLDKWLDSKPVCMFVGMLLGLVVPLFAARRFWRRRTRQERTTVQPRTEAAAGTGAYPAGRAARAAVEWRALPARAAASRRR